MAQIAVTILDPSNRRSAHLVETRLPVREVLPPIVTRLKLPERATYQLFALGRESALDDDKTLAESGIPAGAELLIKPVRNQILKMILDKLYDEAKGYVEDQAWELAKEKLESLFGLDPTYPDPLGLEKVVTASAGALRSIPRTEQVAPRTRPPTSARLPASTAASNTPPATPLSTRSEYQLAPVKSGASCMGIALTIVGVIVVGSIAIGGAAIFLPGILSDWSERLGVSLPGSVVLGTGDVQVTLRWEGEADLDLHVIDPSGEEIWFGDDQSASGGILDVDANGACEGLARPVENIYWPTGQAPNGTYAVSVVYYQACGREAPTDYEVTITVDGEVVEVINAQMFSVGETHPVINFEY